MVPTLTLTLDCLENHEQTVIFTQKNKQTKNSWTKNLLPENSSACFFHVYVAFLQQLLFPPTDMLWYVVELLQWSIFMNLFHNHVHVIVKLKLPCSNQFVFFFFYIFLLLHMLSWELIRDQTLARWLFWFFPVERNWCVWLYMCVYTVWYFYL